MESELPACSVCISETKMSDIDVKRYTFRALFTSIECVGGENDISNGKEKNMAGNKCLKAGEFKIQLGSYCSTKLESCVYSGRMFPSARYLICNVCNKISKPNYSYDEERNFIYDHIVHIYFSVLANWWEHKRAGKEMEVNPSTMQLPHSDSAMNILFVRKKDVESAALDAGHGNGLPLNGDVFKESIKKARPRIMAHSGLKYSSWVSTRIEDTMRGITKDVIFEYGALMLTFKKDANNSTCCIVCETSYDSHFPDPETIYGHFKECLIGHKEVLSLNTYDSLSEVVGEKITTTVKCG